MSSKLYLFLHIQSKEDNSWVGVRLSLGIHLNMKSMSSGNQSFKVSDCIDFYATLWNIKITFGQADWIVKWLVFIVGWTR